MKCRKPHFEIALAERQVVTDALGVFLEFHKVVSDDIPQGCQAAATKPGERWLKWKN